MNELHEAGRVVGVLQVVSLIRRRMNAIAEEEMARPPHEQAGEPGAVAEALMGAGAFQELQVLADHLLAGVAGPCPS